MFLNHFSSSFNKNPRVNSKIIETFSITRSTRCFARSLNKFQVTYPNISRYTGHSQVGQYNIIFVLDCILINSVLADWTDKTEVALIKISIPTTFLTFFVLMMPSFSLKFHFIYYEMCFQLLSQHLLLPLTISANWSLTLMAISFRPRLYE